MSAPEPPWLADAAEALGEVRPEDGAPLALNWTQVIAAIHELREDRDHWKLRAESAEYALAPYASPPYPGSSSTTDGDSMRANREQGEHGTENASSCSGPNGERR